MIALFGAEGQLGRDLQLELAAHGVEPLAHGDVDITNPAAVQKAIGALRPRWIINAAAMTHVDDCEGRDLEAFRINALGALHVARAACDVGAMLLHMSTDYVFDGKKGKPYNESDPTHPLNAYGISKLAGELYVRNTQPNHYIVRTSGLYGLHPCRGKGRNFVDTMLGLAESGKPLKVVSDEILTPTFTRDLAHQIGALVESGAAPGIYHATNDGQCSWFAFAREIFRIAGAKVDLSSTTAKEWSAPASRPSYSVLANDALGRAGIDWMPDWKDALSRYLSEKLSG